MVGKHFPKQVTPILESHYPEHFPKQVTPIFESYHPELDDFPLLSDRDATKNRAILGSAGWYVTLSRFDVAYATNTLARYNMAPREGHYKQVQCIFGCLSNPSFIKGRLLIDPNLHAVTDGLIKDNQKYDWTEFYPDVDEEMPPPGTVPIAKGAKAKITKWHDVR